MHLFLDIDGVLNTETSIDLWETQPGKRSPSIRFDSRAVEQINRLLLYHPWEIVISSSWKKNMNLASIRRVFLENGIFGAPVSVTPQKGEKGEEILEWLASRGKESRPYLVLDDQKEEIEPYIPEAHFIHVKQGWTEGFSEIHLRQAIHRIGIQLHQNLGDHVEFNPRRLPGYQLA